MNRIFGFFPLMIVALFFASCGGDDNSSSSSTDDNTITCSINAVSLANTAATASVDITTTSEWSAYADQDWLTVNPSSSIDHSAKMTISATENTQTTERTGTVTIICGKARAKIAVTQAAGSSVVSPDSIKGPAGYSLAWHDEFSEGTKLGSDWTYQVANSGWVNNELQNYVAGDYNGNKIVYISDGTLKIVAKKIDGKVYSGRVYAKKKTGWKYGYMEARMKLPQGKGTWPAFWMMPVNYTAWPADGEIDIMEAVGYIPNVVYSTIHCTKYNNGGTSNESGNKGASVTQFHKYAMMWTPDYMTFYIDGNTIFTYKNDGSGKNAWPFDAPFYIILNLAWGGAWGGQGGIDESVLPATMEVDYVRVFQK